MAEEGDDSADMLVPLLRGGGDKRTSGAAARDSPRIPSRVVSDAGEGKEDEQKPSGPGYQRLPLFCVVFFPALAGLLFGYDIGATSGVLVQLTGDDSGVDWAGTVADSPG